MWYSLGKFLLRYKVLLLAVLLIATGIMGYYASKVQLSYEFTRALPTDNIKYKAYQDFLQKFGNDGNTVVIGFEAPNLTVNVFNAMAQLHTALKQVPGVQDVISTPTAVGLRFNDSTEKIEPYPLFHPPYNSMDSLQKDWSVFAAMPFYNGMLYNAARHSYLMAVTVNKDSANSKARTRLMNNIVAATDRYEQQSKQQVHISGLPYIRTRIADKIAKEMNGFLIGSLVLSAITLLLFFRSVSATVMSLLVVGMGVIWSIGTMVLLGFKITLLTALIPPLIVVIGIPNCIYFLNKYHTAYDETNDKTTAIVTMVGRMGIVTLFCNIAAAVGFAVFALTESALLKEFGLVSGINILVLFLISLIFIPVVLSYMKPPTAKHTNYLRSKWMQLMLTQIEYIVFNKQRWVYAITSIVTIVAIVGCFQLNRESFIVDDLPKQDEIYVDLKWFESNFEGVMPLEIVIDTKRKNGLTKTLQPIERMDAFSKYLAERSETARPLSFVEGMKFARQAYYDNDSTNYTTPTEFDIPLIGKYLKQKDRTDSTATSKTGFAKLMGSFMDSTKQYARISVNMKDIGSKALPTFLNEVQQEANTIFDTSKYHVTFTGTSVTFLEGSTFIINGLQESIIYAFLLIALCMLYLFRGVKILLNSLIPNVVPLVITAGIMGWTGVSLKPSTVLVFSVALGIAIDVTIRFLVNYKQELPLYEHDVDATLRASIYHTGISIIYTSIVLVAGFVIFCFSDFGGTKGLGWLTSATLVVATLTNLILLPCLMRTFSTKA
jgi:predicted RND superfamily exporter protein